ncbi:uncharacterized protein LOC104884638 [Beta vulgaris subsp. vulgaris]|uniref:uncharacterized protein LOC104884638 n=1 Tax=Beta vulgaris subsp. vulgaris TaxID=3555 RepID=UPI00053FAF0A|nr:uncharacterized protein LOC104884638 [Beta vulgaris subsp. vulgaris]
MRQAHTGNIWLNFDEKYTIKAGYHWLHPEGEKVIWHNWVWNSFYVSKHSLISWMDAKGKLRTRDKLVAVGVSSDNNCALCNQATKDCHHLFFRCPFSKMVCTGLLQWLGIRNLVIEFVYTHWKKWGRNHGSKRRQKIGYVILAAVVYEVWKARNSAMWNLKVPCPKVVVRRI